jgi:flagellar hook-length control protein FliK
VAHARLAERDKGADYVVELHPPELGKVHVHLQSTREGISAHFLVAEDGARALIEGQIELLRQRLQEAAAPVVRFSVGDLTGGWQHQPSQRGWRQPQEQRGTWRAALMTTISAPARSRSEGLDVVA